MLLPRNALEPGLPEEPVPSLIDCNCFELENALALQVGLSVVDMKIPDGRVDRALFVCNCGKLFLIAGCPKLDFSVFPMVFQCLSTDTTALPGASQYPAFVVSLAPTT